MLFFLKLLALFFCWLIFREVNGNLSSHKKFDSFSFGYLGVLFLLVVASLWLPMKYWNFERQMAKNISKLAGVPNVSFHCNSAADSMFDNELNRLGHANLETRRVVFQVGWCKSLMRYIDEPVTADRKARLSLHMLTHEAMHIRGELVEEKTDCQALQRDVQTARLLGVPESIAKLHTEEYYTTTYPRHPYYSSQCAPGKALDEGLPDAPWEDGLI